LELRLRIDPINSDVKAHDQFYAAEDANAQTSAALAKARDELTARISGLTAELKAKAPLYWDYRSPEPLDIAALQAMVGSDAALLHPNETVVLWMVAPGKDRGLVFAVSKDKVAWAQIGLSGDELDAKVKALRAEIDPQGGATDPAQPFDRKMSHDLYTALLGDPQIQPVIGEAGVDTLLIVPSGSLTSLPPALLVVDAPTGSDTDPAALRSTHWLIRDKAIAVLPAVSSLRTLRELLPQARTQSGVRADLPLLALADPDFHGDHQIPRQRPGMAEAERSVPTARAATVDGRPKAEVLADLPSLYGTLAEGEALAKLLDAPDHDLLLGPEASKTELMARQSDGTLVRTRVVAFSTHGLVTGDFNGLTEPALALAHPPANADASDDGLLTASQAAALKLDADWVVLSACNTASPEAPGAEGLSGLARAFFYAGADSLLVSHWRVRDDAAQRLVTETFRLRQADPKLSKAQALRKSMLALLDDSSLDDKPGQTFANPQAWAPFVVVGEAE
jgi:CHAT domain-containing protein